MPKSSFFVSHDHHSNRDDKLQHLLTRGNDLSWSAVVGWNLGSAILRLVNMPGRRWIFERKALWLLWNELSNSCTYTYTLLIRKGSNHRADIKKWREWKIMCITNVQGIKKEYCVNLELLYFVFKNCFMLSVRISWVKGKFAELDSSRARTYNVWRHSKWRRKCRQSTKKSEKKGTVETTGHPRSWTASSPVERNKQIILCFSVNDCSVSPFFQMLILRWADW